MLEKLFWLGIGCRRGISKATIATEIDRLLSKYQLTKTTIIGVATIDLKARELALQEYCRENNFHFQTFSRSQLERVEVPHPTKIISDKIGIPSVAEAAAILAASTGCDRAILIVPKQVLPEKAEKAIMTIAIARSM